MRIKFAKPTAMQKSIVLSVLAGIGVCATGVLSAKCAKKTNDDMTKLEKVKVYAPAIASGGATIGCIALSSYISHEEVAAITAACVALGQKFSNYRETVNNVVTDEQREQIDHEFYLKEIDRLEQELAERDYPTDEDDLVTFVDSYSAYTFKARKEEVEAGIEKLLNIYKLQEFLCWCDVFYILNNKDSRPYYCGLGDHMGQGVGWSEGMIDQLYRDFAEDPKINEMYQFDICLERIKDSPVEAYEIQYSIQPEYCFMEY